MYQIYFILEWHSTCFGRSFRPSSGVQDCTYSNQTDTAICTVFNSWRWTERPSETCRVSLQNKIIWYIGASGWFYLLASRQQYLFDKCLLLYVQSWTADDGQKDRPKHVECHFKIKWIWYIGASSWFYYRKIHLKFVTLILAKYRCRGGKYYTGYYRNMAGGCGVDWFHLLKGPVTRYSEGGDELAEYLDCWGTSRFCRRKDESNLFANQHDNELWIRKKCKEAVVT